MYELTDLLWLALLGGGFLFWWQGQGVREVALAEAKKQCGQHNLQLLDQSVALRRVWVQRNPQGRLCVRRVYRFEFSYTGDERNQGEVIMLNRRVGEVRMDAYPIS